MPRLMSVTPVPYRNRPRHKTSTPEPPHRQHDPHTSYQLLRNTPPTPDNPRRPTSMNLARLQRGPTSRWIKSSSSSHCTRVGVQQQFINHGSLFSQFNVLQVHLVRFTKVGPPHLPVYKPGELINVHKLTSAGTPPLLSCGAATPHAGSCHAHFSCDVKSS